MATLGRGGSQQTAQRGRGGSHATRGRTGTGSLVTHPYLLPPPFGIYTPSLQPAPPQTHTSQPSQTLQTQATPQFVQTQHTRRSEHTERLAKRRRFDFGEDITVLIGPEQKRYTVHRQIICQTSEYFRALCNGQWKESSKGVVKLDDVMEIAFNVYICWIYTGRIDVLDPASDAEAMSVKHDKNKEQNDFKDTLWRLAHAFALGDRFLDLCFQNTVIDEYALLSQQNNRHLGPETLTAVWETVPSQSCLMRAVVDTVAVRMKASSFNDIVAHLPSGLVNEIAKAQLRDRELDLSARGICNRQRCFYHDHTDGKGKTECCSA